jgi:hypothetical protein
MIRFSLGTAAVLFAAIAMVAVSAGQAQAQGCGYGGGYYGGGGFYGGGGYGVVNQGISLNVGGGRGGISVGYSNFGYNPYNVYRPNYNYRPAYFHDTSHYDYHPGQLYRHGNHLHYQPGHYDLHRTGHWHR